MILLRSMMETDLPTVKRLLTEVALSCDHVQAGQQHYFVLEHPQQQLILGAIGLEIYNRDGLLRTFVVERELWNEELGTRCMKILFQYAREKGLQCLYLVALAVAPFFTSLGFVPIDRDALPAALLQAEPIQNCPADGQIFAYYFAQ